MTTGRWLGLKRWKAGRRSADEHYKAFLETSPPAPSTSFDNAELVCLDIETTGLDPATVDMLSIGWVIIRGGMVDLSTAESHVVKPSGSLGDSPSIHGLTDSVVDQGMSPDEAMERVIEVLTGRVLAGVRGKIAVIRDAGRQLQKACIRAAQRKVLDLLLVPVGVDLRGPNVDDRRSGHDGDFFGHSPDGAPHS